MVHLLIIPSNFKMLTFFLWKIKINLFNLMRLKKFDVNLIIQKNIIRPVYGCLKRLLPQPLRIITHTLHRQEHHRCSTYSNCINHHSLIFIGFNVVCDKYGPCQWQTDCYIFSPNHEYLHNFRFIQCWANFDRVFQLKVLLFFSQWKLATYMTWNHIFVCRQVD